MGIDWKGGRSTLTLHQRKNNNPRLASENPRELLKESKACAQIRSIHQHHKKDGSS